MSRFPKEFIENTSAALGGAAEIVIDALESGESVTAVRANPAKMPIEALEGRFEAAEGRVPWRGDALFLSARPQFTLDSALHAGAYYVQDPSAMFAGCVASAAMRSAGTAAPRVLDLCAAPGGKTTCIAASLGGGLLVANEVISSRATVLAENVSKWGNPNVVVCGNDPAHFASLPGWFDVIVTDVPCSGEGMFRKEPQAVEQWSQENVRLCEARSRRIVADVWPALREGGFLVYSTCTFNSFENDGNAAWIAENLGAEIVHIGTFDETLAAQTAAAGNIATRCGVQLAPGITRGEGQYVALLRKTAAAPAMRLKAAPPLKKATCEWMRPGYACSRVECGAGAMLKAYPEALIYDIRTVEENLRTLRSGVAVALVKGRDRIPQPDLALSPALSPEAFPEVELSREQALQYLRLQPLALPDAPEGFLKVCSEGLPLGFVKNLGRRANNLFPRAWRLRM